MVGMLVFLVLIPVLPSLVAAVMGAFHQEPEPLPGLSERESADFLWLDWMLSVGLYDTGLARRYVALASTIDFALTHQEVGLRAHQALSAVRCDGCGEVWTT